MIGYDSTTGTTVPAIENTVEGASEFSLAAALGRKKERANVPVPDDLLSLIAYQKPNNKAFPKTKPQADDIALKLRSTLAATFYDTAKRQSLRDFLGEITSDHAPTKYVFGVRKYEEGNLVAYAILTFDFKDSKYHADCVKVSDIGKNPLPFTYLLSSKG